MLLLDNPPSKPGHRLTTEGEITDGLRRYGIDHRSWPERYDLKSLRKALDEEQVAIEDTGERILIRVQVAVVLLRHLSEKKLIELTESSRILLPERSFEKRDFRGIAETLKRGESTVAGAHRTIAEEPGYSCLLLRDQTAYSLHPEPSFETRGPKPSEKWNGVWATWERTIYSAVLNSGRAYKPHGYFEIDHGKKISIFRWKDYTHERAQILGLNRNGE